MQNFQGKKVSTYEQHIGKQILKQHDFKTKVNFLYKEYKNVFFVVEIK